jgi:serine/threonine protein kinase
MHGNGVTHRDLKPSNILIADGHPKITDFGFCDIAGSAKPKMFYNVGSPSYMSPEAYMDNIYGEKSDVWAAGGILYEMLVGSTIDKGKKNITELYEYLKAGRQFVPNGISPFSKTTLTECFKYDSRKRSNFHALEILLDNALGPMQQQQISTVHQSNIVSPQQHTSIAQSQLPPSAIHSPGMMIESPPSMIQSPPQQPLTQKPLRTSAPNPVIQPNMYPMQPQAQISLLRSPINSPTSPRQMVNAVGNPNLNPSQYQPLVQNS